MVCCFLLLVSLVTLFLINSEQVCDPAGIQTQDLQNRNLTLYSAKLQGLRRNALVAMTAAMRHWATAIPPLTSSLQALR